MNCDREVLLDDLRRVHQSVHDSEYPFALLETQTVRRCFPNVERSKLFSILDPAFHAFNSARKQNLRLYPGVKQTLDFLSNANVRLVAHTESKLYAVIDRLRRLDLQSYFARVYCREGVKSTHPSKFDRASDWFEGFPLERIVELSHHQMKPNPDVLLEICATEGAPWKRAAYVGDSIARDILMAKRAGVFSIWAEYGSVHDPNLYSKLVRVTHWTPAEVAREQLLKEEARNVQPDFVARTSFAEIVDGLAQLDQQLDGIPVET